MFLEDAKVDCVRFVCTWFQQIEDGTLMLGSVQDLARYLRIVDLKLVDGSSNASTFADPASRGIFLAALHALAEPEVENLETL